jgi:hypothetical protein
MIDFSVEPAFQEKLDWMAKFVREECEVMDLLFPETGAQYDTKNEAARRHLEPLQDRVKEQGLCHSITCSATREKASRWRRRGRAEDASTMRCVPSDCAVARWT